jgi:hypothetical protein
MCQPQQENSQQFQHNTAALGTAHLMRKVGSAGERACASERHNNSNNNNNNNNNNMNVWACLSFLSAKDAIKDQKDAKINC